MKEKRFLYISVICSLFIGVIGTLVVGYFLFVKNNTKVVFDNTETKNITLSETDTIKSSISKIYDAVYVIQTFDKNGNNVGTGTGFVYKKDKTQGYVLTNHHVISGAASVKVVTSKKNTYDATILGSDEYSDIAVLSVPLEAVLQVATIGNSSTAELGDAVFTVGSPLGIKYQGTVTKGILSGLDRQVTVQLSNGSFVMNVLQTDAAINPGNSGGPFLNMKGEVIGITSMKLVEDQIEGMGFALPIEFVMSYVDQLEKGETIKRPLLGVQMVDVSSSKLLAYYGINIDSKITTGVAIVEVQEDSPAEDAGLQKGDVILAIEKDQVEDSATLKSHLYTYQVGDTIHLTISRDGKEKEIQVKLTKALQS